MKRIRIIALLSAVVMFVCLFLIMIKMNNSAPDSSQKQNDNFNKVSVVKAKTDIPPYTTLTEDMLEVKEILVEKSFSDYFEKKENVVGRIAVSDIFSGDIVSHKRVAEKGDTALGLAFRIEEGMRAITLEVNIEQGVANTLKVGNFVDIIFTGSITSEGGGASQALPAGIAFDSVLGDQSPANSQVLHSRIDESFAVIAMQNVKVLSLNDKFFHSVSDPVTGNTYGSVTLEVTPQQAAQLVLIKQNHIAYLVLRNQNDAETVNGPRGEVFQSYTPDSDR